MDIVKTTHKSSCIWANQNTRVRIQSSATFIEQLLLTVWRKDEINEKEAENGPFLKKKKKKYNHYAVKVKNMTRKFFYIICGVCVWMLYKLK